MVVLVSGATATVGKHPHVGVLVVPGAGNSPDSLPLHLPWACDNGAFSGLDVPKFLRMLKRFKGRPGCLFVTAPDVVGNAAATMELFDDWEPVLHAWGYKVAFVGQNGLDIATVPWTRCEAVFLGGSSECVPCAYVRPGPDSKRKHCPVCGTRLTEWKLGPVARDLAAYGKVYGKHVHMGRVNSAKRLRYAIEIGCDTVDGRQWSVWAERYQPKITEWIHPRPLPDGDMSW